MAGPLRKMRRRWVREHYGLRGLRHYARTGMLPRNPSLPWWRRWLTVVAPLRWGWSKRPAPVYVMRGLDGVLARARFRRLQEQAKRRYRADLERYIADVKAGRVQLPDPPWWKRVLRVLQRWMKASRRLPPAPRTLEV